LPHDKHNQPTQQQENLTLRMRGLGARTVIYQQNVASRLGLNNSDFLAIDILHEKGPITAGELAKFTGLTTGSVTALIDRLEKSDYVRRQPDPNDRRKVILVPVYENKEEVSDIYLSLHAAMIQLASSYEDIELELIAQFLDKACTVLEEQIHDLNSNISGGN